MSSPRARASGAIVDDATPEADVHPDPADGALAPLAEALDALAEAVEAASDRLRAGRTDHVGADASAISERASALDGAAQPILATLAGDAAVAARAALSGSVDRVQGALASHARLVTTLQGAARSLAAQAKREQVKRAGGGLYSAEGASAGRVATSGGRVLGQL